MLLSVIDSDVMMIHRAFKEGESYWKFKLQSGIDLC